MMKDLFLPSLLFLSLGLFCIAFAGKYMQIVCILLRVRLTRNGKSNIYIAFGVDAIL